MNWVLDHAESVYLFIGAVITVVASWLGFGNRANKALSVANELRKDYDRHIEEMEKRTHDFILMQGDITHLKDSVTKLEHSHESLDKKVDRITERSGEIMIGINQLLKKS